MPAQHGSEKELQARFSELILSDYYGTVGAHIMPKQFLMLPPQNDKTRELGARLAEALPELDVIVAEDIDARRAGDCYRRDRLRHASPRVIAPGAVSQMAAGAAGGTARRLLLSGADRPPRRDHQFPRNI